MCNYVAYNRFYKLRFFYIYLQNRRHVQFSVYCFPPSLMGPVYPSLSYANVFTSSYVPLQSGRPTLNSFSSMTISAEQ